MAEWRAVEALNESVNRTIDVLFKPFNLSKWLKIAFIVFMLGLGGTISSQTSRVSDLQDSGIAITKEIIVLVITLVAVLLLIGLVLQFISAVFNFIFIEALMENRIELVEGFKRNAGKGLSLFLFGLAFGIISIAIIVAAVVAGVFIGMKTSSVALIAILIIAGVLLLFCYMIFFGIIFSFTTDFVVPLMHFRGYGIIKGWGRLITLLEENFKQFIVYLVIKIALGIIAAGINLAIFLVVFIIILLAAVVLGGGSVLAWLGLTALFPALGSVTVVMLVLALFAIIVLALIFNYVLIVLTLPIPVFFRYYSLHFIRRIDPKVGGSMPGGGSKALEVRPESNIMATPPASMVKVKEEEKALEIREIAKEAKTEKGRKKTIGSKRTTNIKIKAY